MEEKLHKYALLSAEEKKIKAQKEQLKKELEEDFGQQEMARESRWGVFKMVKHTKWNYSSTLAKMQEDIDILKEDEKENGTAKKDTSFILRFNPQK